MRGSKRAPLLFGHRLNLAAIAALTLGLGFVLLFPPAAFEHKPGAATHKPPRSNWTLDAAHLKADLRTLVAAARFLLMDCPADPTPYVTNEVPGGISTAGTNLPALRPTV